MKKLLLILFISILPCTLFAGDFIMVGGGLMNASATSPSCTTADDSLLYIPTGIGGDTTDADDIVCQKFTLSVETMVTEYIVDMCEANQTGSLTVFLFGHDAVNNYPDETNLIANSTVTLQDEDIADCFPRVAVTATLGTPILVDANTYWVCTDKTSIDRRWSLDTSSSGDRKCYSNDAGSTWTCANDAAVDVEVWGCQ